MKRKELFIKNLRIKSFPLPPKNFIALNASEKEMMLYGIAPKPDPVKQPKLYSRWREVYSKPLEYVEVGLQENADVKNKRHDDLSASNNLVEEQWSGLVFPDYEEVGLYSYVTATWTVPNPVTPPGKGDGQWCDSSAWVGIGEQQHEVYDLPPESEYVLQIGTHHGVQCINGQMNTNIYPWVQLYPEAEARLSLTSLQVYAGDVVSVMLCLTSGTTASFYFVNETTHKHTSGTIEAPAGTDLWGLCTECILERPTINGQLNALADYGDIIFSNVYAGTRDGHTQLATDGLLVDMQDLVTGAINSKASLIGENVKCEFVVFDQICMGWKGYNDDQGIYFAFYNGFYWLPQQNLAGSASSTGPAMLYALEKIYMVWKGADDDRQIYYTMLKGDLFNQPKINPQQIIPGAFTMSKPCITLFNQSPIAAWAGGADDDKGIHYAVLSESVIEQWQTPRTIPGVGTSSSPDMIVFNSVLYVAWKGVDDDQGIYWTCSADLYNWAPQNRIRNVATSGSPSLTVFNGKLYIAWKGAGSDTAIYYSYWLGGNNWEPQQVVNNIGTAVGPALISFSDQLCMGWRGEGDDQGIYYSFYDGINPWSPQLLVEGIASSSSPSLTPII